ncbi:hypothetical protein [Thalassotalea fusca]
MPEFDQYLQSPVGIWLLLCMLIVIFLLLANLLFGKAKRMSKGAVLFLMLFPLISLFPIPPPQYENVDKAKQEQKKAQIIGRRR